MLISAYSLWPTLLLAVRVAAVWPQPRQLDTGSFTVWMAPDVVQLDVIDENAGLLGFDRLWARVQHRISSSLQSANASTDPEPLSNEAFLQASFARMKESILSRRFVPRKFHPRGATFEPSIGNNNSNTQPLVESVSIKLTSLAKFSKTSNPSFAADEEAYSLQLSVEGNISITSPSLIGALHALQTLEQLFYAHSQSDTLSYTPFAPVSIVDGPAFKHRGLNLDISRNYIPPKDVLRVIEAMGSNKFNRLHIHAADAQSWPLEIPALPRLALLGAYDPTQIWKIEDLRRVQQHGQLHGIEVYIEIDIPGHTTAIGLSQPQLITAPDKKPWQDYAAEPPSGQLRLNSTDVYEFLTTLFGDLMPRNARYSKFFHLGGDELNRNAYASDPTVNSSSAAVLKPFLQKFMDHAFSLASKHSQTPILWEEMLLEWNLTLPSSTIIQTWRSNEALVKVLSHGHRVLFGANSHFYLDCGFGSFLDPEDPHNPTDSPAVKPPYLDYCTPYKNWRHVYAYNPLTGIPEDQRHLVWGGEVHLWGELTDPVTIDGMLWPRAAAAAEMMWRGPGTPVSEDTTRRLAEMRERLVLKGVAAGMVQMEWCLRHVGGCTF